MLFDMILPTPTYVSHDAGRGWDHIDLVVRLAADLLEPWWPFAHWDHAEPIIYQRFATPKFSEQPSWKDRDTLASGPFQESLLVSHPEAIRGSRLLVVDDIFTEGLRTNAVARRLMRSGASQVCGLVFARHLY